MTSRTLGLVALTALVVACHRRETNPPAATRAARASPAALAAPATPARPTALSTTVDAGSSVARPRGCSVHDETRIAEIQHDVLYAQIAAVADQASVTWSETWTPSTPDPEGHDGASTTAIRLTAGPPVRVQRLPVESGTPACAADPLGTPAIAGSRATWLSYGVTESSDDMMGRQFTLGPREPGARQLTADHEPVAMWSATNGDTVLGITMGTETPCADMCACEDSEAPVRSGFRALRFGPHGAQTFRIWSTHPYGQDQPLPPDAPEVAAFAARADGSGLIVYRDHTSLRAVRLGADAHAIGTPIEIVQGSVGAPALAFRAREAVIVWADRAHDDRHYQLHAVTWDPDAPQVPAPVVLTSGANDALAPAVSVWRDRVVLAWTEGDTARRGVTRLGASAAGIVEAARGAEPIAVEVHDRDPEIAVAGERAWLLWQRFPAGAHLGEMRVGLLDCP